MYLCTSCNLSETNLKNVKEHMQNTDAPKEYDQLTHLKLQKLFRERCLTKQTSPFSGRIVGEIS